METKFFSSRVKVKSKQKRKKIIKYDDNAKIIHNESFKDKIAQSPHKLRWFRCVHLQVFLHLAKLVFGTLLERYAPS